MRRISLLLMVVGLAVVSGAPAMASASHTRRLIVDPVDLG